MFTNNKFAKMDSIANLINTILETDTKSKMEELKGGQHKIDKNKNNKIDAQDFAILRGEKKAMKKEETEQVDEISHQAKTTMKHVKNPTAGEMRAARDIRPGIKGYRDRIDMLKSAEADGRLKKEEIEQIDEIGNTPAGKQMLGRYLKKAARRVGVHSAIAKDYSNTADDKTASPAQRMAATTLGAQQKHKRDMRLRGVERATDRLTKEEVEQIDEAVDMSDAKSVAAHLAKKAISLHGISKPNRAAHHAKNADAIEKTIDRVKRSQSPSSLAKAHTEVGSVSTAVRRMNVARKMSSAEKSAHKSLQSGVVKHLEKHLDQHRAAFRNAAAKFAAKNEETEQIDEAKEPGFRASYGLGKKGTATKKPETYGKRVQGKGYDKPENERKAPEGNVAMTSLMPGHDERAAKFLARQVAGTGRVVKGKAQSAAQPKDKNEEIDPKNTTTDTLRGREKSSKDPFLSKKVFIDVPGNVKEESEQVDERTLTAPEKTEKEKLVKGMKPYLSKFTKRYGAEKGKSVMYGRATKLAKEKK